MGKKETTKEKILVAAVKEFSDKEFGEANTDEIAQKAGVSKGVIFLHFENKIKLYCAAAEYCLKQFSSAALGNDLSGIKDFFERVSAVSKWKLSYAKEHFDIFNLLYKSYFYPPAGAGESIKVLYQKYYGALATPVLGADFDMKGFRPEITKEKIMKYINLLSMGMETYFRKSLQKNLNGLDIKTFFDEWNEILEVLKRGMQNNP